MGSRLLHRDADLLVLDKPAGLAVHPGRGGGETLADHLDALRFGLPQRPEIAHRLDRETSGCLALGRHKAALARLGALFRAGSVEKTYWAVVLGGPGEPAGTIDLRVGARKNDPGDWSMRVDPNGQPARTHWRVLGRGGGLAWIELSPETGRTHQLRVHCAASGWPILGDALYRDSPARKRSALQLHAQRLVLPFSPGGPPLDVSAPPPAHMRTWLAGLGWTGEP